jgi:hypothetical protein
MTVAGDMMTISADIYLIPSPTGNYSGPNGTY